MRLYFLLILIIVFMFSFSVSATDVDIFRDALKSGILSNCGGISDQKLRNSCYRDISVDNLDLTGCDLISLTAVKDTCFNRIAIKLKNVSLCSQIESSIIKSSCQKKTRSDIQTTTTILADSNELFFTDALKSEDIGKCKLITDKTLKDSCFEEVAIIKKNQDLCNLIVQQAIKENCFFKIAISNNDIRICPLIKNQTSRKACLKKTFPTKQATITTISTLTSSTTTTTLFCDGCIRLEECIPYGIRVGGQYCGDSKQLKTQKNLGGTCQKNYECFLNNCVKGKCIAQQAEVYETKSFFNQLLDSLKKIFGL